MQNNIEDNPKRSELLKVLCILSFIGGGLSIVSNSFMFLFIDDWVRMFKEGQFDEVFGNIETEAIELFINIDRQFFLIQAILYAVSVTGVYYMWKLKKPGFHLYSISQILMLIMQKLFLPSLPFPVLPLLLTITFIFLYYKNLSYMR